ncbi:C69 family dipeptidase [Lactobacillus acetotolerans]|uniref:Dipeptidase n=1 Tax=Lactobacillus acetotolerans TaxID=1600 RepID=A0A5P5ZKJ2_9LACO|nr:C69 family dipeptidase [Lactobacillus acetotolerans]KRN41548.1 cytosol non-specific dipeptidase [Lactobacillus acetotolerans DSM 20749 = JCM 3825]QFG51830.1 C69 family dipeptidase [Lactobacillus acetotolerans]GGV10755.1 dipeptidase [Lactobacillus acetotolerans DSM 20749 = JCM 3825]
MNTKIGRSSCTSILIGKKASLSASVIIGRNEDAKTAWPKHLAFNKYEANNKNNHFKSKDNKFEMDLPREKYAYSSTPEWTDKYGIFEEDGINQYHVAMSATESAYANDRVIAADPFNTKSGILEEAMVTVVLPYIKNARDGVQRLGKIIEKHGAAEADGILFADRDEAWYMEIGSGHYWVAQRIPDDSYAVAANQLAIQEINFNDSDNFMFTNGLKDFVYENHLWPKNKTFIWREIFGTHNDSDLHYNTPRVWSGQRLLTPSVKQEPQNFDLPFIRKPDKPISIQDAQAVLSNHYENTPYDLTNKKNKEQPAFRPISVATTQESHLLELNGEDMTHWLAMGVAAQSVYIPFYPQGTKVPNMWKNGKETYSPNSAYWIFKLASTLVDRDWGKYGTDLGNAQDEAKEKVLHLRYQYDQKLANEKNKTKRTALVDEANAKMAKTATDIFKDLSAKLITKQTADSPLSFKMDPDL